MSHTGGENMKKILVLSFLILGFVLAMSFELSVLGGMELSGKNRPYIGARVGTLSAGISLMLEAYYPLSTFEQIQELDFTQIQFVELDPYLYIGIPIGTTLIYAGTAPIIIFDIVKTDFAIYSYELFHAKVGLRFGSGIVFFIEGMTTLTTSFQTLGIYAVTAGIGIGF